jgi:predicted nuclease of predicted toxin-antitoxin system
MKLLLDTCVWGGAKKTLESSGHDVVWTGDWFEDPGDEEILAKANDEDRILVTLDKDFGEIAIVKGKPHSGILRLVNLSANNQGIVCLRVIEQYGQVLQSGAIITVEPGRIRIRPPDENKQNQ